MAEDFLGLGPPLSAPPLANSSLGLLWANHQGRDLTGPWPINLFNQLRPQVQNLLTQAWHHETKDVVLREEWCELHRDATWHNLSSCFSKERAMFGKSKALAKKHTRNKWQN